MNLNFKMSELIHSDTANKYKINNMPDINSLDNMLNLIYYCLQPLRDKINKSFVISSGYRCSILNTKLNGVSNSGHLTGRCVDFTVKGLTVEQAYQLIKKSGIKYRQLIQEKGQWIHIDYKKDDLKCENLRYDGKKYIKD